MMTVKKCSEGSGTATCARETTAGEGDCVTKTSLAPKKVTVRVCPGEEKEEGGEIGLKKL